MMHVVACLVLAVAVRASALQCPLGCDCGAEDVLRYTCGDITVKARDDGYMEVSCQYKEFNCTAIPQLDIGHNEPLQRLEVSQCSLASLPLACAVNASGATGIKALALQGVTSELKPENVQGLDFESLFMMFMRDAQRSVPTAAIDALPSLRSVRLLSGTDLELRPGMFAASPPLEYLEISMSGIKEIPEDAFKGLDHLTILSLWGNQIGNISVDAFTGLTSLEQLRLNNNPFRSLPPRVFRLTPRLRRLCAERVQLEHLYEGVVSGLLELQEIKLKSDAELTLGPKSLSNLPSLTSLIIPQSKISSLPPDLFINSTKIVNLTLSYNRIKTIPEELLWNLKALERLDLSGNAIEAVSKRMFTNLVSLVEINLNGNKIRELPDVLFSGLTKLKTVSLNSNLIHHIAYLTFLGAESLEHLHLSKNQLSWAPQEIEYSSPFNMLLNLKTLRLSHNNISIVYSDWRFILRRLDILDLSYNAFTSLLLSDVQFLAADNKVTEVDFRHNQIYTVQRRASWTESSKNVRILLDYNPFDCNCQLYDFLTEIKQSTKYKVTLAAVCDEPIQFKNQPLLSVPPVDVTCSVPMNTTQCQCLVRPGLQRTECDCVEMTEIPDLSESGFVNMSLRIRSVPNDLLSLPDFVRVLNLSDIGLEKVPYVPKSVDVLDLTHNNIKNVPKTLLNNLNLSLAHNPLVCDCWTTDEIVLLQNYSVNIVDYENVTCSIGSRLSQVDAQSMCNVYKSSVAGILFAVTLIFIAFVAAILYRHWIEVQVLLYRKRWCLFMLPREDIDYDKKYDVFVSFAYEDEKFVCEEILPRLEGKYILHVQDRDWVAGDTIPTEIHRSVAESKRTLIVLSENFIKSIWATEEFRTVHTQASNDKRTRAVVILLNMTKKQLDKETKTFLTLSTIIRYGERMFWDKVVYALPRKDLYDYNTIVQEFNKNHQALDLWKGHGLNVIVNDAGKLVNAGYIKDVD